MARYTRQDALNFIEKIGPLMKTEAEKRGYRNVSCAIAQAVVESAAGKSLLASQYFNFYGLKCGSSWKGPSVNLKTKEEYQTGVLTTIKDNFRVFKDIPDGVKGYYDFIGGYKRYSGLKTATDYKTYAVTLKNAGYATSSTYVNTLCKVVELYDLTRFDKGYLPTLKKGSKGGYVKELQTLLNYSGIIKEPLVVDGVFGNKTAEAVEAFQASRNLVVDGIVGPLTWAALKS